MCLQYNELVRDIVPQALERFNVCIKFILDLYLNSINKFQAKENPTKYPNEHVMNILRCAEVGIFELWNMIEPNGYSFEDAMEKMSNSFQKL
mgnify:CR=1 FL=1